MQRIVVLGGGVGGTLVANLLARKLKREIKRGEATVTVVDDKGEHIYQPGFMYIAMGNEKPERLKRPERSLLDDEVRLEVGRAVEIDEAGKRVVLEGDRELPYEQLILATGSRIVPEEIANFEAEAHHFYGPEPAQKLRDALDAFTGGKIVIGIAGMPYKCPPAPLEVAFLMEHELRQRNLRDRSEMHYCSPIGRAFTIESVSEMATPILEEKGIELHTFFNV
ncbi:MAG TPA: FAD/NAD(P)-binding oxidoreductase, partial [Candidatus Limnocylindria bacterium]